MQFTFVLTVHALYHIPIFYMGMHKTTIEFNTLITLNICTKNASNQIQTFHHSKLHGNIHLKEPKYSRQNAQNVLTGHLHHQKAISEHACKTHKMPTHHPIHVKALSEHAFKTSKMPTTSESSSILH